MQTTERRGMQTKRILGVAAAVTVLAGAGAVLAGGSGSSTGQSRLDDGRNLLSHSKISEQHAIEAAQRAASGDLYEVDLQGYLGHLVFNVDVGTRDVKVDASNGNVLSSDAAD
jgi:uncharacterized membrane protein YkoI